MLPRSSIAVVLAVGAATGVILARGAVGAPTPPVATATSTAQPAAAAPAAPATAAAHDEVEPDESPVVPGENPYEESAPNRSPVVHQPVVARDGMLRLGAGHFVMGSSSPRAPSNERPARPTNVPPFWIDRTEVTVGAYRACVGAAVCSRPARTSATCTFDAGDPELPVSCVHWRDADAYCRFAGKRLPSEREWEYAARGTFPASFPWGGGPSCANAVTLVNDQSGKSCASRPARVGSHPSGASMFGVQDLSGNVEEWTADWYVESLGPGPAPRAGAARVLRGGGWLSTPSQSRTTSRDWGSALEAGPNVGFRCAKDAE
ncbi:MAG TPA: formylglycine-generating enzyme family protein [Polyangiaceae bacterium]|jgi:serine/threonine-protein kinase